MYEHPYLTRQITRHEQEQMERAAARRVFLLEHQDQIVPRPESALRRMLRSLVRREAARPTGSRQPAGACEAVTAR